MAARIDAYVDTSAVHRLHGRERHAARLLRRFGDQDLTLADAVGLHPMQDDGAASCWSTDRHLGLTGTPLAIHTV